MRINTFTLMCYVVGMNRPVKYYTQGREWDLLTDGTRLYVNLCGESLYGMSKLLGPRIEEIRKMLIQLRHDNRWSEAYMAAVLGVPKITLRKWESGERRPSGAARKLIWLLHGLLMDGDSIHNDRDIATWGQGKAGEIIRIGGQSILVPNSIIPNCSLV